MRYENMIRGEFISRPNRFIAHVKIHGKEEICHVKNTGRCKELLTPGATVWCQSWDNPKRKTKFDLIAVQKGDRLINMDSQAPNTAAGEWLRSGGLGPISELKGEYRQGDSRFDFSFIKDGKRCFLEVKGVTLEHDGVCAFPDAPTERGAKHLLGVYRRAQLYCVPSVSGCHERTVPHGKPRCRVVLFGGLRPDGARQSGAGYGMGQQSGVDGSQ